jgi:hypothetical protein
MNQHRSGPDLQSSAKSLGIDAGDGQRGEVNTRCHQDISKIESPRIEY